MKYDFASIEKKWQQKWLEEKPFTAVTGDKTREKFFGLIEFPYPSGQGLHVGHARPFTAMDIICRKKRMQGYNVLFPIGYDAFGLPTENYAVQHHIHPAKVTHDNIENFRKQLHMLGYSFDWDREVNTTDPSRSRSWREVTNLPSLPAKGESLTEKVISRVGALIFTKGNASTQSGTQMVSPMVMSGMPLMAMMLPAVDSVTGFRARPSNS